MSGHDAERAYVAAVLDARAAQLADTTASMRADLDRLRESWSSSCDRQLAGHQERLDAMRAETAQYIKDLTGAADEPAPEPRVAGAEDASVSSGTPNGHRPQQPNPHEAEADRAREIAQMDMATYASHRAALGVQSATNLNRLFS